MPRVSSATMSSFIGCAMQVAGRFATNRRFCPSTGRLTVLVWYAVPVRAPARLSRPRSVSWPQLRKSVGVGFAVVGLPALAFVVVTLLTRLAGAGWTYAGVHDALLIAIMGAAGAMVAGYARSGNVQIFLPGGQPGPSFTGQGAVENPTVAFRPGDTDGTLATCGEGRIVTVRAPNGYRQPWRTGHLGGVVTAMSFTDDGTTLVTGSDENTVRFLDTGTGTQARPPLQSSYISGIASVALPDGTADRVVIADANPAVEMWTD